VEKWSDIEVALLIDTYFNVKNGKLSRNEGLKTLSSNLRKIDMNQGKCISDLYRNINGMSWQFGVLESLNNGKDINREAPKSFKKVLDLYEHYRDDYDKLLEEAKELLGVETVDIEKILFDIKDCLIKYYPYGFRFSSSIEMNRFKKNFLNKYGYELILDDKKIYEYFNENCIIYNNKAYCISENVFEIINNELTNVTDGVSIIYYDIFYEMDSCKTDMIISSEMLDMILRKLFSNYLYKQKYFIIDKKFNKEFDALINDVELAWGNSVIRNVDFLRKSLVFVPIEKIKYALSYGNSFVWNSEETYANTNFFICDDITKDYILKYAKAACDNQGFFNFNDLSIDAVYEQNYEMTRSAVMACVMKLILVDYDKVDKVIRRKGDLKSHVDIITDYSSHKKRVTINELADYQKKVTGTVRQSIIIDAASSIMIRIDETTFINKNMVSFDAYAVDKTISEVFQEKSIGMKEIVSFSFFPECGVALNHFLLESYLRHFSLLFKYCTNISNSGNAGAIVRKDVNIDYFDILVDAVIKSTCSLNKDEILAELVNKGYLLKRLYKRIDDLIDAARLLKQ
jgi:hypothetical protein